MNKAVSRLFQLRKALDECEKDFGLTEYSEVERAAVSYTHLTLPTKRIV